MIKLNENQKRAVETIDKNVLVKAGAGAGKTAVLTERFINLVKKSKTNLDKEKILAITFTNKAVDEMKKRVIKRLMEEKIPFDFNINIFTFDSFFKRVVDKYDSEKYIGFTMIEEYETEDMLKEIALDIYEGIEKYRDVFELLQILNDSYDIERSIEDIVYIYNRTRNIFGNINYKELISPGKKHMDMTIGKIIELSKEFYSKKNKLWDLLEERFSDRDKDDYLNIEDLILIAEATSKEEITIEIQNSSFIMDFLYEDLYTAVKEILDLIDYRYHQLKKEQFLFDFTDITLDAIRCMIQNIDEMRDEYSYIMIDEFQDTSPLQMKFFKILTDDYSVNNIFVVGDVKQSIYRFRGADYKNIINFENDILSKNGEIIELNTNYRSKPELINFTNDAFIKVLPNYSAMNAGLNDDENKSIFNISIDDDLNENIARTIVNLVDKGYKYEDIGILSSRKTKNIKIINALNKYKIPFVNHNPESIADRPECREMLILLNAMIETDNKFYLLALLRGLIFDMSDVSISNIIDDNSFYNYAGNNEEIKNAKLLYTQIKEKFLKSDISSFINYVYNDLGFFGKCKEMWGIESANNLFILKKYLISTTEVEQKSLKYAIIKLQRDKNIESVNLYSKNENAVHLSTIHKSKGLEYKVVILPDLSEKKSDILSRFLIDDKTLYVKFEKNIGSYHIAARKEKQELKEEDNRLLYVAITRAKEKLIIASRENITPSMILAPIINIFDDYKVELEIKNVKEPDTNVYLNKKFIENIKIGELIKDINPSSHSDVIDADTSFGDFIHHFAEMYVSNGIDNLNKLIDLYKVDEVYDYEKIMRHINNVIKFLDSREGSFFAEKNIIIDENKNNVNAVIDRLEILDDKINIIDFKTVEITNSDINIYNNFYKSQLDEYKRIVSEMYQDMTINTFVFYTSVGRLEEIL